MRKFVTYVRSRSKYETQSQGPNTQSERLHEAAQLYEFNIIQEFREVKEAEPFPVLDQAIRYAADHRADLLIARLDRLGTTYELVAAQLIKLRELNVVLWLMNGQVLDAVQASKIIERSESGQGPHKKVNRPRSNKVRVLPTFD